MKETLYTWWNNMGIKYQGYEITNENIKDFVFTPNEKIGFNNTSYPNRFIIGNEYNAKSINIGEEILLEIFDKNNNIEGVFLWRFDIKPKIKAVNE